MATGVPSTAIPAAGAMTASHVDSAVAPVSPPGGSPVERLPTELLRQILEKVLPPALNISFTQYQTAKMWRPKVKVTVTEPTTSADHQSQLRAYAPLLRTCKIVSREARAMLYSSNQFSFRADLPLPNERLTRLPYHTLRDMKDIQLILDASERHVNHEQFFERFVDVIGAHGEDDPRRSVLKRFEVRIKVSELNDTHESFSCRSSGPYSGEDWAMRDIERCMYTLEVLTKLPKTNQVKVSGPPTWFSHCVELCIQDAQGSTVPVLRWPTKKVRKTKTHAAYHKSTRHAGGPILDWREFAQRYNIIIPEQNTSFYAKHNNRCSHPSIKDDFALVDDK